MTPELQDALARDYPELFADINKPMQQTCMCWGCECGDGWEPLIRRVCNQLVGLEPPPVFDQIKEKYGGLRIYYHGGPADDSVQDIVDKAERQSLRTCEVCGAAGAPNYMGWISTLCGKCRLDWIRQLRKGAQ